mgnify:CR=1 FL=1
MTFKPGFETPLVVSGPLRAPRQMLADQEYGGHASILPAKQRGLACYSRGRYLS